MFDHYLSDAEADSFVASCEGHYEPARAGPRVSSYRTNDICRCNAARCAEDVHIQATHARVMNLTSIPISNAEPTSIVRYRPGQLYGAHHDQTSHPESLPGVRVYTVLLYLLQPLGGGETYFPALDLAVAPKRGRALIWANVFDSDPSKVDERVAHEAMQTTDGTKVAANIWLHQFDLITHCGGFWDPSLPNTQRCSGCTGWRDTGQ